MARHPNTVAGLPAKILKVTPFELPKSAAHDEWLLDEALIETFPASDPIAVSPNSPEADDAA